METASIISPIAAFVLSIAVQILARRTSKGEYFTRSFLAGFGAGLISLSATELLIALKHGPDAFLILANLITYVALCYGYFHFLNLGETGRRIRLLMELREHPEGIAEDGILALYNAKEIIEKRIARLKRKDQIILENGRYSVAKSQVLYMSRILDGLKLVLFGKR